MLQLQRRYHFVAELGGADELLAAAREIGGCEPIGKDLLHGIPQRV